MIDADGRDSETDYQCQYCNGVYHGPHAGMKLPEQVHHISAAGEPHAVDSEHPGNISHGICPSCEEAAPWRREQAELHRQRFKRGRR